MSAELKAFKTEAERIGLKEETVCKMVDQDIDSLSVVVLMREADISALSLSIGQMLLWSRWLVTLHDAEPAPSESVSCDETSGLQDQTPRSVAGKALFRVSGTETHKRTL